MNELTSLTVREKLDAVLAQGKPCLGLPISEYNELALACLKYWNKNQPTRSLANYCECGRLKINIFCCCPIATKQRESISKNFFELMSSYKL